MRSNRHARPCFLADAGRFASHDARGELRNDVNLCSIGKAKRAQCAFEPFDELTSFTFARATVSRQRCEFIADALQRLGNGGRELAQVAAQARRESERVVRAHIRAMPQLEILQHSHRCCSPANEVRESVKPSKILPVCARSQNAVAFWRCI
jgi:hypothetical protein